MVLSSVVMFIVRGRNVCLIRVSLLSLRHFSITFGFYFDPTVNKYKRRSTIHGLHYYYRQTLSSDGQLKMYILDLTFLIISVIVNVYFRSFLDVKQYCQYHGNDQWYEKQWLDIQSTLYITFNFYRVFK